MTGPVGVPKGGRTHTHTLTDTHTYRHIHILSLPHTLSRAQPYTAYHNHYEN